MSSSQPDPLGPAETTFRNYSAEQAKKYADLRPSYTKELTDHIIAYHKTTGGQFGTLLDIGCGPGNATRGLAVHFDHAIGIDPSPQMVEKAKETGGDSICGSIEYRIAEAESCEGVAENSVDMITAATAAHWFDMERFWPTAAKVLKPKGTVAIFIVYRMFFEPSTPQAEEANRIMQTLLHETLEPFQSPGNVMVMENYKGLKMPWDVAWNNKVFDQEAAITKVWNEGGRAEEDGSFLAGVISGPLNIVEMGFGTASAVTRWREAHPDLANTEKDCVKAAFAQVADLFEEKNPVVGLVGPTTLILVKRQ